MDDFFSTIQDKKREGDSQYANGRWFSLHLLYTLSWLNAETLRIKCVVVLNIRQSYLTESAAMTKPHNATTTPWIYWTIPPGCIRRTSLSQRAFSVDSEYHLVYPGLLVVRKKTAVWDWSERRRLCVGSCCWILLLVLISNKGTHPFFSNEWYNSVF